MPVARLRWPAKRRLVLMLIVFAAMLITLGLAGSQSHGAAVFAQEPSPTYDPTRVTIPLAPPSARAGMLLYSENCAPCHGNTGNGDGPTAPELTSPPTAFADPNAVWDTTPGEFFHTTKFGRMSGMMPPWGNRMDDGEIWDAVAFAWSLHTSEQQIAQGEALYAESCAICHGAEGRGDGPDAEGEIVDFTDQQQVTFRSQADLLAGWTEAHPEVGGDWSSADQAAVLDYIRSFSMGTPWQNPYQPGEGTLRGTVAQGTAGGADVASLQATVDAYLSFDRVATFTTTVTADGAFEFRDLSIDPSLNYIASVANAGINYSSDFITLSPVTTTAQTDITVYETTDDPSVLNLTRFHWIVETEPGALLVGQIYAVGNSSDRTFVGRPVTGAPEPVTFAMQVPPGAQELSFDNGVLGDRFVQVGPVIYDTLPVLPGDATRQVIVRYFLPFEGGSAELVQELLYPAADVSLLVADLPDLKVDATGLEFVSVESMGSRSYQYWVAEATEAGTLEVRMDGLLAAGEPDPRAAQESAAPAAGSSAAAPTSGSTALATRAVPPVLEPWASGVLAAVVAAALAGIFLWARAAGTIRSSYTRDSLGELRENLLDQLAHLDDLHALGDVGESEYLRQRAQLKAQLVDVVARLKRSGQAHK